MYQNDPVTYFNHIDIPVLAIIGEFDSQVTPDKNLQIAANCFNDKNESNKIMEMNNLNHMLQPTDSYKDYSLIDETVSTELLEEILHWIQAL
jgi:pimeloyl-ACP methyl ester carboxylesterase